MRPCTAAHTDTLNLTVGDVTGCEALANTLSKNTASPLKVSAIDRPRPEEPGRLTVQRSFSLSGRRRLAAGL